MCYLYNWVCTLTILHKPASEVDAKDITTNIFVVLRQLSLSKFEKKVFEERHTHLKLNVIVV